MTPVGGRRRLGTVDVFYILDRLVLCAIGVVAAAVRLRLRPALRQRPDAFTAVGRLTKNAWLGITGASALFLLLIPLFGLLANPTFSGLVLSFQGPRSSMTLFWLAGLVATLVYLVDVRPAVAGCSGGTSAGDRLVRPRDLGARAGSRAPRPARFPGRRGAQGVGPAEAAQVGVAEIDPRWPTRRRSAPPTARRWTAPRTASSSRAAVAGGPVRGLPGAGQHPGGRRRPRAAAAGRAQGVVRRWTTRSH